MVGVLRDWACGAWGGAGYRPGAGYLSACQGLAWTMTPMIMQGLPDLLAQAWLTPWTTAVSPGWMLGVAVGHERDCWQRSAGCCQAGVELALVWAFLRSTRAR
jgi:hypothetical protein